MENKGLLCYSFILLIVTHHAQKVLLHCGVVRFLDGATPTCIVTVEFSFSGINFNNVQLGLMLNIRINLPIIKLKVV